MIKKPTTAKKHRNNADDSKKKSGFTLLELLIVIGVISVLATTVMVGLDVQESLNDSNSAVNSYQCKQLIETVNHYITTEQEEPQNLNSTYQQICKLNQTAEDCINLDTLADEDYLEVLPYIPANENDPTYTGIYACFNGNIVCSTDPSVNGQDCTTMVAGSASSGAPVADTTPPTIAGLSPADEATGVSPSGNLVITFSEAVTPVSGNITIKEAPLGSVTFETIDVTSGQVTGGGTDTITINPTAELDPSTQYYVEIDATAFDDLAGNSYFGHTDPTAIGVVSAAAMDGGDGGIPVLYGARPINDFMQVAIDEDQISDSERNHTDEQIAWWLFDTYEAFDILNQSATIIGEAGLVKAVSSTPTTITLRNTYTDPIIVATPVITSSAVEPAVTRINTVTTTGFNLYRQNPGDVDSVTAGDVHYIVIEAGAHTLPGGVALEAGSYNISGVNATSSWNSVDMQQVTPVNSYTTPVVLGQVMSTNDADWQTFWASAGSQTAPPTAANIYIGRHVGGDSSTSRSTETVGYIIIEDGTGTTNGVDWSANLTSDTVAGVDDSPPYTFNPSTTFESTMAWNFTTGAADVTAPTLDSTTPTDDATDVSVTTNLVLNFSEAVDVETGNITIKRTSDNVTFEQIDVTSGQVTGGGTATITVNPTGSLANYTEYYVQVDATAFDDAAGNSYAGISSTTAWSFTTESSCVSDCVDDGDCSGGETCRTATCSGGGTFQACAPNCGELICGQGYTEYCGSGDMCYGDDGTCGGTGFCPCLTCIVE